MPTLKAASKVAARLTSVKATLSRLSAIHSLGANTMPTPNTSVQSTITVTDINSNFVNNLSTCGLSVKFPDGSTQILAIGTGITNAGNGQYNALYITKGVGIVVENWSVVAADGSVGNFQFDIGVGF